MDAAGQILLGRVVGPAGVDEVRFRVQETLKGQSAAFMDIAGRMVGEEQGAYRAGDFYLAVLEENGDQWSLSAFYPVEEENDWVRTVRLFAGISALDDETRESLPAWLKLPSDEGLRTDLTAVWLGLSDWGGETLGKLLREKGGWRSARNLEELARLFETSKDPAERRQILVEIFHRQDEEDETHLSLVWRLLQNAKDREADLLLRRVAYAEPSVEELEALYRAARTEEEKDKVVWGDSVLGEALAASGDPEILDAALKVLHSPGRDDDPWALRILARSPLPAAAEETRRILAEGGDPVTVLQASMPEASEPPQP